MRVRARPNLVVGLGHPVAVLARRRLRVDHGDGFLVRVRARVRVGVRVRVRVRVRVLGLGS